MCGNKAHSIVLFGSDESFTKVTARHVNLTTVLEENGAMSHI